MRGYFFIADILGFKNIIKNIPKAKVSSRISEWITLVETAAKKYSIKKYSLLSDTLFVAVPSNPKNFENIILMGKYLLEKGILKSIPIRGAITHGNFEWGDLVYGKPIIEAHDIEINQNWIGITCSEKIPKADLHWGEDKLICYSPPMKTGTATFHPVISWDIPTYERLSNLLVKKGLAPKGKKKKISYEWLTRIDNTIEFRIYKKAIRKNNLSYDKMHGISSIAYLDNFIDKEKF